MTNSEQAIREFAEKWGIKQNDEPTFDPHTENLYYGYTHCVKQCLSDLTALISEHYVAKEEVDKMVSERLREEMIKYDKYIGNKGWIDNYEDETAIPTVDEYLKSRVSHD